MRVGSYWQLSTAVNRVGECGDCPAPAWAARAELLFVFHTSVAV